MPNTLKNPITRLVDARGRTLDSNNDWMKNPDKDAIIENGLAPTEPRESAMIDTLSQEVYTMIEQGNHRAEGVAVPEFYDLSDGGLQLSAAGTRGSVLNESTS
ncbi:MAG: hypothetical protein ABIR38_09200 [Chthoniobacterales bacterium]